MFSVYIFILVVTIAIGVFNVMYIRRATRLQSQLHLRTHPTIQRMSMIDLYIAPVVLMIVLLVLFIHMIRG